ncbi:asparagine synthase C-terminal domain-containing protein [Pseudoxanthomonas sp.]|uniref:asparagine synthase-related protein n=1 Tax=Pseudoxanthomonas sp. TaxID=1871049 RepID=UPI002630F64D|nr:asparagine synthase C-terminal domain-containing protein [Pseudoxanthomonas sp.]WDS34747.1 MAG: asparagine synthase C-terminal domain-containing protein [Pseudoxanthomonas sp.]
MEYPYLFVIGAPSGGTGDHSLDLKLKAKGMSCRFKCELGRLFTHPLAPVVEIPGQGLLLGAVFDRDGTRIPHRIDLDASPESTVTEILRRVWGNYLALLFDRHSLRVMRDPSGSVDCVYAFESGRGFITSHISLAVGLGIYRRDVDWEAVAHSLQFPFMKTARTALKRINELPPGCELHIADEVCSIRTAWSPWQFVVPEIRHRDAEVASQQLRKTVSRVVNSFSSLGRRHMVELSGGLDSSIVSMSLRDLASEVVFCTITMPASGTDESAYARAVTDALGQPLLPVEIGAERARFRFPVHAASVRPSTGILQDASNQLWDPLAHQHGIDSFFSGGGGDSIFCYLKTAAPAADAFLERGIKAGFLAIRDLSSLHKCTLWKAGRLTLKKLRRGARRGWKQDRMLLARDCLVEQPDLHPWLQAPENALPGDHEKIQDLVGTQLFREATPRNNGKPLYFPLLSQPVMEACLPVPSWMWISGGRDRAIARNAFADVLPAAIANRRSKGSYTGYLAAVYSRNKQAMRAFLMDGELRAQGLLDPDALERYFDRDLSPRDITFTRIFELCAAENWVQGQMI